MKLEKETNTLSYCKTCLCKLHSSHSYNQKFIQTKLQQIPRIHSKHQHTAQFVGIFLQPRFQQNWAIDRSTGSQTQHCTIATRRPAPRMVLRQIPGLEDGVGWGCCWVPKSVCSWKSRAIEYGKVIWPQNSFGTTRRRATQKLIQRVIVIVMLGFFLLSISVENLL